MTASLNRTIDAVVAGYLGVDLTPGFSVTRKPVPLAELLRPGKLIETEGLHVALGGVVANTGLAMRRFGRKVELMGCVGHDAVGELALSCLAEAGVTHGVRRIRRAGTAYGVVIAPPGLDRFILEDPGCNDVFTADDVDYDVVAQSRLFHFGYPPLMRALWIQDGRGLKTLLKRVRKTGAAISLDMTLPDPGGAAGQADWQAILANTLPQVDIFVPSIEEILFMMEPKLFNRLLARAAGGDMIDLISPEVVAKVAERILRMGVKIVLIKAGPRGAYLRSGDLAALDAVAPFMRLSDKAGCPEGVWLPSARLEKGRALINACGAGDCAVAGFLAALLGGVTIKEAGKYAMIAGRDNLYGPDALSGLRSWAEMTRQVKRMEVSA